MGRNIYDEDRFFAGYSDLPRSRQGLAGAPEWPAVRALLPDLRDARILDLGCGFGAFDRWAVAHGAHSVIGVDLSENMLRRARKLTDSTRIDYRRGDITALDLPERGFDLIYSALVFHYIDDLHTLSRRMRERLTDGGRLVLTVEHPIFTAPGNPHWQENDDGTAVWPLDRYLDEGRRTTTWFTEGVVKYHRTIGTYLSALIDNGFRVSRVIEWGPDVAQISEHPEWARERDRPMFLLIAADAA